MYEILRLNKYDNLLTILHDRANDSLNLEEIEKVLKANGDDHESRARLLGICMRNLRQASEKRKMISECKKHIRWFVRNTPAQAISCDSSSMFDPIEEPELFQELATFWERNTSTYGSDFDVLFNASIFYENAGKYEQALALTEKCRKMRRGDYVIKRRITHLKNILNPDGSWKVLPSETR